MRDVNFKEWAELIPVWAERVRERWPGMRVVDKENEIRVEVSEMSGNLGLGFSQSDDGRCLVPEVKVGASSCYPISVQHALAHHNEVKRVLDALLFLSALSDGHRVFSEGSVPCSHCSGRGKKFYSDEDCEHCGGTGFR